MQIVSLYCHYHKNKCFAFGSVPTDRLNAHSDMELILGMADGIPFEYAGNHFHLKFTMLDTRNHSIDLPAHKAVFHPLIRQYPYMDNSKQLIYEKIEKQLIS